jgi:hypothetical protein
MLKAKGMPGVFWGEAVTTAVYVLNRAHTRSVDGKTPYETWYWKKPAVEHLWVFGCVAHVRSARPFLRKLDDRSTPMVFVEYEPRSKAYRVYDLAMRRVHVSRDVMFDEAASWDWSGHGGNEADGGDGFVVEYTTSPTPRAAAAVELDDAGTSTGSFAASPTSPVTAMPLPSASPPIKFATPPSTLDPELFDIDDDAELLHRYRRVSDLLEVGATPPGLAERLLLTSAEEPSSVSEA